MNASTAILQALGWSLLHFVWQGAMCALLLASVNVVLRRATAQARYVAATATLLVMLGLPVVSFALLRGGATRVDLVAAAADAETSEPLALPTVAPLVTATPASALDLQRRLEPFLPAIVALWTVGVLVLSLRGFGGWIVVQRLRRTGLALVPDAEGTLVRLAATLAVSTPVRLYESALVQVPTVIGWVRPMILLPASVLTGLAPEQIELILAHELAHVRRRDYLVNLFQTAAETLLFYHPGVWWVSQRMRVEREHCCDDIAAAAAGGPLRYARALADLEELCRKERTGSPVFAMAATNGSLLARITRLLSAPNDAAQVSRGLAGLLATSSLCVAFGLASSLVSVPSAATVAPAALAAPVPITAPSSGLAGAWTAERSTWRGENPGGPSSLQLSLRRGGAHENWSSSHPVALDELPGLTAASIDAAKADVRFEWKRDAGVFTFDGSFDRGIGAGHFTFAASAAYIADMRGRGYDGIDEEKALALAIHDVSRAFVAEMTALGYTHVPLDTLMGLRIHGATAQFVRELAALGYPRLALEQVMAFRIHGVSLEFVRELQGLGFTGTAADQLVAFRIHGVSPDLVRAFRGLGYERLTPDDLVSMRIHGVSPEFVTQLKALGYTQVAVDDLVSLRIHGVTADFIQRAQGRAGNGVTVDRLVSMRIHGENRE